MNHKKIYFAALCLSLTLTACADLETPLEEEPLPSNQTVEKAPTLPPRLHPDPALNTIRLVEGVQIPAAPAQGDAGTISQSTEPPATLSQQTFSHPFSPEDADLSLSL